MARDLCLTGSIRIMCFDVSMFFDVLRGLKLKAQQRKWNALWNRCSFQCVKTTKFWFAFWICPSARLNACWTLPSHSLMISKHMNASECLFQPVILGTFSWHFWVGWMLVFLIYVQSVFLIFIYFHSQVQNTWESDDRLNDLDPSMRVNEASRAPS